MSDLDPRFTSRFWEALQKAFDITLRLSKFYHLQNDGQTERTIQTLEDILRACVLNQQDNWDSYNNSHYFSIWMAPYRGLYN